MSENSDESEESTSSSKGCQIIGAIIVFSIILLVFIYKNAQQEDPPPPPPPVILPKEKLLTYLQCITGSKTISGIFLEYTDSHKEGAETLQEINGVLPGILATEMPRYSDTASQWQLFIDDIISNWNNDILVHIQWWKSPLSQVDIFKATGNNREDEKKWKDLVRDGGYLNKAWKTQLDIIVPYFQQLEKAGVVVIVTLFPIMNFEHSLWRGRPGVNGSLRLYQLTHDYLTNNQSLSSLIWTWHLHSSGDMTQLGEYWPGNNYVDVASVYMFAKKKLATDEYLKLLEIVGDKPIAMDYIFSVPTPQLLAVQSRWTWFTTPDYKLKDPHYNNAESVSSTFDNPFVINRGELEFFKTANNTIHHKVI